MSLCMAVTWALNSDMERLVDAFCINCLLSIMWYCLSDIISNQQLHDETESRSLSSLVYKCQLQLLYGHMAHFLEVSPAYRVVFV